MSQSARSKHSVWQTSSGERGGWSGRPARPFPATSLSLTTTLLSYPHSPSICIMLENHLAAAEGKLLFISQTWASTGDQDAVRTTEQEAAGGLTGAQADDGCVKKLVDSEQLCPHTLTRLRFDCFAADRALTSTLPLLLELEGCTRGTHSAHTRPRTHSRKWKPLKLSWEEYIKGLRRPSSTHSLALYCLCYSSTS